MRRRSIDVEGLPIAISESEGDGPAALLVHGNSVSSRIFERQFSGSLGAEFRLIALDLPGHGESGRPRDADAATYSLPGFGRVLAGVARTLDVEHQVFVGWSLGGHIVLEATKLLPHAAGFCIFGTPPLRFPPNLEQAFLPHPAGRLLFQEHLTDEDAREWVASYFRQGTDPPPALVRDLLRTDSRMRPTLLASIGAVGYEDEVRVVEQLDRPLAILHGARDAVINRDYIASLRIPSLWHGAIQDIDAGHAPHWERPAAFDALIREFLLDVS